MIVHQILHTARAVHNVDLAVTVAIVAAVVDDRAERSESDTSGDEEQVVSRKRGIHGERSAVRTADGDLLSHFHGVKPFGHTTALLDGEFHEFGVGRRGGNGEHRLTNARNRKHRTLPGHMVKCFFAVRRDHTEGFDIRRINADVGYNADLRDQRFFHLSHCPALLTSS